MARKPLGRLLRIGLFGMAIGALLGIDPAVHVGLGFARVVLSDTHDTASDARTHLDSGRYTFYELVGKTSTVGVGITVTHTNVDDPVIRPGDVDVRAASGGPRLDVVEYGDSGSETITRNDKVYVATLQFRVPAAGSYVVHVTAPTRTRYIVSRGLGDTFHALLGWILVGVLAGLLFAAGMVAAIVGAFQRAREPQTPS